MKWGMLTDLKRCIGGDLDDPHSEVSRLIKERGGFGTRPSVYYLPA